MPLECGVLWTGQWLRAIQWHMRFVHWPTPPMPPSSLQGCKMAPLLSSTQSEYLLGCSGWFPHGNRLKTVSQCMVPVFQTRHLSVAWIYCLKSNLTWWPTSCIWLVSAVNIITVCVYDMLSVVWVCYFLFPETCRRWFTSRTAKRSFMR